jgi:sterol desaturase/sphingolipid hydroxylase (fatty acid hydroxylase superfamily)
MLQILWDTRGYFFWLLVVSAAVMLLESIAPWRPAQRQLRKQIGQDFFWLIFNAHYVGIMLAYAASALLTRWVPAIEGAESWQLLAATPLWIQFIVFLVIKDLLEWGIHNLLHRVPFLWAFHKVHHSIVELDWIGNFRIHWFEIAVYRALMYLPLAILGVDGRVVLWIAILTTLIGHLNHSNLNISWGPLRYLINSARMHVWHHMYALPAEYPRGVNFGISFSLWDWLFGTAYWPSETICPEQQPKRLGFPGIERYPRSLLGRLLVPISLIWAGKR